MSDPIRLKELTGDPLSSLFAHARAPRGLSAVELSGSAARVAQVASAPAATAASAVATALVGKGGVATVAIIAAAAVGGPWAANHVAGASAKEASAVQIARNLVVPRVPLQRAVAQERAVEVSELTALPMAGTLPRAALSRKAAAPPMSLEEETRRVGAIRALVQRDPSGALEAIGVLRREAPASRLAAELALLEVQALRGSGKTEQAGVVAGDELARDPSGLYGDRLRSEINNRK